MAWTNRAILDNLISLEERNVLLERLAERNVYDDSPDGVMMREAIVEEMASNEQKIEKLKKKFKEAL